MHKRLLGNTGFEVSIIGIGGIPIQKVDESIAVNIMKAANEQGINFIDTARGYGKSEELIGYGLEACGRENWIVATKSPIRDYQGMKEEIRTSLSNLKTDIIDLYQLHNVRTEDEYREILSEDGALKALQEAKTEGLIREIGITSHDLHILEKAVETGKFATIQFPYSPVERQAEDLFNRAKELNIGVIVMKPLAGGAITKADLSLRFIAENSSISVIIPGMENVKQVIENSRIGNEFRPLNDEERADEIGSFFLFGHLLLLTILLICAPVLLICTPFLLICSLVLLK